MQVQDFFDYKNQLMNDLLTNEDIVKLIEDDINVEDAGWLAYKRVFPYEFVPETVQDGKTFICFDVDIQRVQDKTFLYPTLFVWVFTHKSLLRLPDGGGVRTDRLCHEICKQINGSREYGLGELNLYSIKRFVPMTDFQGKVITFTAKEFNRQYDANKYTPGNRKNG